MFYVVFGATSSNLGQLHLIGIEIKFLLLLSQPETGKLFSQAYGVHIQ